MFYTALLGGCAVVAAYLQFALRKRTQIKIAELFSVFFVLAFVGAYANSGLPRLFVVHNLMFGFGLMFLTPVVVDLIRLALGKYVKRTAQLFDFMLMVAGLELLINLPRI